MLLFGDRPLDDFTADRLGLDSFAEKIAESILAQSSNSGLVLGIEGKWGSGKSSLTVLIEKKLRAELSEKQPIIIKFDPWIVRGVNQLVGALFDAILDGLNDAAKVDANLGTKAKAHVKSLVANLHSYKALAIEGVSTIAEAKAPGSGVFFRLLEKLLSKSKQDGEPTPISLMKQKAKVGRSIQDLDRSLLICVDDIDRLDPEEAMEVMRLVRAVADFPNTIYLLNYDPEILAHAAERVHGVKGARSYLEKIVNVTIRVPAPEAFDLRAWFEHDARKFIQEWMNDKEYKFQENEAEEIHNSLNSAADLFLKSPRFVRRALDSLRLCLGSLPIHVWLPDVVWLSIVKVGSGELYNWIEEYTTEMAFIAQGDAVATDADKTRFLRELNNVCLSLGHTQLQLLSFIRPNIAGIADGFDRDAMLNPQNTEKVVPLFASISDGQLDEQIRERRLSSPEHYRYFFSFQNPRHAITVEDENDLALSATQGATEVAEVLTKLDNQRTQSLPSKLERMLRYLRRTKMQGLDQLQRLQVLRGLTIILDNNERFEETFFSSSTRGWQDAALLLPSLLLQQEDQNTKYEIAEIFTHGNSIGWLTFVIRTCEKARREGETDKWLVDWQFETAQKALLSRYDHMDLKALLSTDRPTENFYGWFHMGGKDACKQFMLTHSQSDDGLLSCLELMIGRSRSTTLYRRDRLVTRYNLRKESIAQFFDADIAIERIQKLEADHIETETSERAKMLLDALEQGSQY